MIFDGVEVLADSFVAEVLQVLAEIHACCIREDFEHFPVLVWDPG